MRKRTGTVQRFKDADGREYWRARVTLPGGARVWLKQQFETREAAEDYAARQTADAAQKGITVPKVSTPRERRLEAECLVRDTAKRCGGVDRLLEIVGESLIRPDDA